jgi:hypothetical protein
VRKVLAFTCLLIAVSLVPLAVYLANAYGANPVVMTLQCASALMLGRIGLVELFRKEPRPWSPSVPSVPSADLPCVRVSIDGGAPICAGNQIVNLAEPYGCLRVRLSDQPIASGNKPD